ncbi:MAG TPA: single-stranded DNA-binding protein [Chloroflexota bacterium]
MAGMAKAMIIGNVGRDAELRYTPEGRPVTTFSVACSRVFTGRDGERREETQWFTVVTWGRLAETCSSYVSKGRKVFVEGRLQLREWTDREGQRRTAVEVVASDVQLLDSRPRTESGEGMPAKAEEPVVGPMDEGGDLDDVPF